jgi:hypothetical protein
MLENRDVLWTHPERCPDELLTRNSRPSRPAPAFSPYRLSREGEKRWGPPFFGSRSRPPLSLSPGVVVLANPDVIAAIVVTISAGRRSTADRDARDVRSSAR